MRVNSNGHFIPTKPYYSYLKITSTESVHSTHILNTCVKIMLNALLKQLYSHECWGLKIKSGRYYWGHYCHCGSWEAWPEVTFNHILNHYYSYLFIVLISIFTTRLYSVGQTLCRAAFEGLSCNILSHLHLWSMWSMQHKHVFFTFVMTVIATWISGKSFHFWGKRDRINFI